MSLFSVEGMNEALESHKQTGKKAAFFSPVKTDPFECNYTKKGLTNTTQINFSFSIAAVIARRQNIPEIPVEFVCIIADILKLDLSQGRLNAAQRVAKHIKDSYADKNEKKAVCASLNESGKSFIPFKDDARYIRCIEDFQYTDMPLNELSKEFVYEVPVVKKKATPKKRVAKK